VTVKIYSICCVRDENDIIRETLDCALEWSELIFVFDNGSIDGTWDTLQELARANAKVQIVGRDNRAFSEELRGDIFESYRSAASPGDWWCRLDADEIYIDDPLDFLGRVPANYGFVRSATFNFYFTDVDLEEYKRDPPAWLKQPVQNRLKFYQNNWSEGRFVRHRRDLIWKNYHWPLNRGRTFPEPIRLKHYQYRSPEQISRRLEIQQTLPEQFPHETGRALAVPNSQRTNWVEEWLETATFEKAAWRDRIRRAVECDLDTGVLVSRNELMPPMPGVIGDRLKALLFATAIGRAGLWPVLEWRRRRRKNLGRRNSKR
jgi:hypothetical protein